MAKKTALFTDWVTIGKAGATVDGRKISDIHLQQAAKNFDPEWYGASININHRNYWGSYGHVQELRNGICKKDGKVTLEARLSPNKYFLETNSEGQYKYTSMELDLEFGDTGEAYLTGLAITDQPASLATTQINFSKDKNSHHSSTAFEMYTVENSKDLNLDKEPSWFTTFKNKFAKTEKQENEMDKEEFAEALEAGLKPVKDRLDKMEEKFSANPDEEENPDTTETTPDTTENPADKPASFTTEDVTAAVTAALTPVNDRIEKLSKQVENATKPQGGTNFTETLDEEEDLKLL